jgi:hypothetical protein
MGRAAQGGQAPAARRGCSRGDRAPSPAVGQAPAPKGWAANAPPHPLVSLSHLGVVRDADRHGVALQLGPLVRLGVLDVVRDCGVWGSGMGVAVADTVRRTRPPFFRSLVGGLKRGRAALAAPVSPTAATDGAGALHCSAPPPSPRPSPANPMWLTPWGNGERAPPRDRKDSRDTDEGAARRAPRRPFPSHSQVDIQRARAPPVVAVAAAGTARMDRPVRPAKAEAARRRAILLGRHKRRDEGQLFFCQ